MKIDTTIGWGMLEYPLKVWKNVSNPAKIADVAELADALASGASGRKVVEVRVLSSA